LKKLRSATQKGAGAAFAWVGSRHRRDLQPITGLGRHGLLCGGAGLEAAGTFHLATRRAIHWQIFTGLTPSPARWEYRLPVTIPFRRFCGSI